MVDDNVTTPTPKFVEVVINADSIKQDLNSVIGNANISLSTFFFNLMNAFNSTLNHVILKFNQNVFQLFSTFRQVIILKISLMMSKTLLLRQKIQRFRINFGFLSSWLLLLACL